MLIEAIDVYRVRIPLAFVWKTSYADQYHTDTILVRMEGGGQHAWGESCPPYIPAYSAEHTLGTFHTVREHMAGRLVGQDIGSAQELLDRLQFATDHRDSGGRAAEPAPLRERRRVPRLRRRRDDHPHRPARGRGRHRQVLALDPWRVTFSAFAQVLPSTRCS
jgi:hypothetical protein